MPKAPVHAVRSFARDLTLREAVPCDDNRSRSAWTSKRAVARG